MRTDNENVRWAGVWDNVVFHKLNPIVYLSTTINTVKNTGRNKFYTSHQSSISQPSHLNLVCYKASNMYPQQAYKSPNKGHIWTSYFVFSEVKNALVLVD